ncbi:MAG TPA: hypothetical protein VN873_04570 [Candidatus Angelobacter sp.]|nr:hypothetical protein [Candidatus Angelobacter sp.]
MTASIQCPNCHGPLPDGAFNQPELSPCPSCEAPLQVEVFPAFFRKIASGQNAEPVLIEGESSCFYHLEKKAVRPCDSCGRFLCALCDCELNGQHFCPACLEVGKSKGKIRNLENRRTRYDVMALYLAILPILFFYFTIVTAPATLFIVIRYWNAPQSIVRRYRFRTILAGVLALLEIAGWIILFVAISTRHHR